jgi:hypothetical protein
MSITPAGWASTAVTATPRSNIPLAEMIVEHGYHGYMIYCVVCHDPLGTGHGQIVERGYAPPPSYHIERLRKAPVGHLFAVIGAGYGSTRQWAIWEACC